MEAKRKRSAKRKLPERVERRLAAVLLLDDPLEQRLSFAKLDELAAALSIAPDTSEPTRWRRALEAARHYATEIRKLGKHRRP